LAVIFGEVLFLRDHNNPMCNKVEKFSELFFFGEALYIWIFFLNIRADSSWPPNCLLGPIAMIIQCTYNTYYLRFYKVFSQHIVTPLVHLLYDDAT